MTNNTRFEFHFGLDNLPIHDWLFNVEDSKRLGNSRKEGIVSDISTGADTTPVAKSPCAWVGLRGAVEVAFWAEGHRVWIDGRVVREPPAYC